MGSRGSFIFKTMAAEHRHLESGPGTPGWTVPLDTRTPQWLRMVLVCRRRRPLGIFLLLGSRFPSPKRVLLQEDQDERLSVCLGLLDRGVCGMWGARGHVSNLQCLDYDWLDSLVLLQLLVQLCCIQRWRRIRHVMYPWPFEEEDHGIV